jgi:hypothetical protein
MSETATEQPYTSIDGLADIYAQTAAFYRPIAAQIGNLGFQILYGPPFKNPPILFLGYQPGGGEKDRLVELEKGSEERWPPVCEYATEKWRLAQHLQNMFGVPLLRQCVGINAIFMRAPTIEAYEEMSTPDIRQKVQDFCLGKVREVVAATKPRRIVAIGLQTLSLFGKSERDLVNTKGRTLTRIGDVGGFRALGVLHLSGARISNNDRRAIADRAMNY